jgi:hypothetical protein
MKRTTRLKLQTAILVLTAVKLSAAQAAAAEGEAHTEASGSLSAPPGAAPSASASANTDASPSVAAPAATTPIAPGGTDHSQVVGHFGVGYLGYDNLPTPGANAMGGVTIGTVAAPVIGVRYWLAPKMGIDAGVGFGVSGATFNAGGTETKQPAPFALALHGGVPLVFAESNHLAFLITPEFNLGFTSNTVESAMGDIKQSGFHFDLGARVGGEVQFGFMGIPQLSLQAGVGLRFSYDGVTLEPPVGAKLEGSQYRFGTTLNGNPWDIFAGSIHALYYL